MHARIRTITKIAAAALAACLLGACANAPPPQQTPCTVSPGSYECQILMYQIAA